MLGQRNKQLVSYGTDRLMRRYIMICHKASKATESMVLFEPHVSKSLSFSY